MLYRQSYRARGWEVDYSCFDEGHKGRIKFLKFAWFQMIQLMRKSQKFQTCTLSSTLATLPTTATLLLTSTSPAAESRSSSVTSSSVAAAVTTSWRRSFVWRTSWTSSSWGRWSRTAGDCWPPGRSWNKFGQSNLLSVPLGDQLYYKDTLCFITISLTVGLYSPL